MSSGKDSATKVWNKIPTPIFDELWKHKDHFPVDTPSSSHDATKYIREAGEKFGKRFPKCEQKILGGIWEASGVEGTPLTYRTTAKIYGVFETLEKVCQLYEILEDKPPVTQIRSFDDLVAYFESPEESRLSEEEILARISQKYGGRKSKKQRRRKHRKTQKRRLIK